MLNTVTQLDEVVAAIEGFNAALADHPALAERLGTAHAFYVLDRAGDEPLFGFSKYVGYAGITPGYYLTHYKDLDGRNTEYALRPWYEEVLPGSRDYDRYFAALSQWMGRFGKTPRRGAQQHTRIMVLRREFREARRDGPPAVADDRRLLELVQAVAEMLPAEQRAELRAAL